MEVVEEAPVELTKRLEGQNVRDQAVAALANLGGRVLNELGAIASVQIGEVVGDIGFFVRPLSEWKKHKIDTTYFFVKYIFS